MNKLITELRRRGVIRVAGLYIALTWLVMQISDVIFPAFDIPDSALRYILYVASAGFPLILVFSWFYELTSEGIITDEEFQESVVGKPDRSYLTVFTLVALILALGVSLYVNFQQATETEPVTPERVSMLVANFDNLTGDGVFDGSLEAALTIGVEGAPFVSSYPRHNAERISEEIADTQSLDEGSARLVAVREGIDLILAGEISRSGDGYELSQRLIEPVDGKVVAEISAEADTKADVLPAVGSLAAQVREALGDLSLKGESLDSNETFTSASIEAVHAYSQAQALSHAEKNVEAITLYKKAIELDPSFGRAYSGWALCELKLGRKEKSQELWKKALELIDGMTERERYRTLGSYYILSTANYERAIENYRLLVEKYPADGIGWNNLGVAYFFNRNFPEAMEVGAELSDMYPDDRVMQSNYALFAMYAGDFALARQVASALIEEEPDYFLAYLPLAMAALADSDTATASALYERMNGLGDRAQSVSVTGMADIALLTGDYSRAADLLKSGVLTDAERENTQGERHKLVYLARAQASAGDAREALTTVQSALVTATDVSHLVPAALLLIELGEIDTAQAIADELGSKLQPTSRAAADGIRGEIALAQGKPVDAVDAFNESLARVDSWLGRLGLGRAYYAAGFHAEALGEFEQCRDRIGEATALFLDDVPTFHYAAQLYYWLGRTKLALGMNRQAYTDLEQYLSLRVESDATSSTQWARAEASKLEGSLGGA